jgi:plastocyanin
MRVRTIAGVLATVAAAGGAAIPALAAGGRTASRHTVVLKNIRFNPGTLNIKRGDTVTWLWRDNTEHNVTGSRFKSRTMERGSFSVRFTHSGTFSYHCTIHVKEGMRGKVVVH